MTRRILTLPLALLLPACGTSASTPDSGTADLALHNASEDLESAPDSSMIGDLAVAPSPDLASAGCAQRPLCEDFELGKGGDKPDPNKWTVASPNCSGTGTVALDDTQAHGGHNSLKVTGKGGYCNHVFIANSAALQSTGNVVYGRYYLQLASALGADHVTFLAMKDAADGGKDLRQGGQSNVLMWNRESDDATLPELSPTGIGLSVKPPVNKWLCVEFLVDGKQGLLQTWVDGAEVAGLHEDQVPTKDIDSQWLNRANWRPMPVDFRLGWESYGGTDMTLWFDDVALDSKRIGCL